MHKVSGVKKLVPNLDNKTKYVVHYKNRQFYLSLGMKLTKVHRVLKLKQCDWLKDNIDFNKNKGKMLLLVLKKIFLNWWLIVLMVKQWKIRENE